MTSNISRNNTCAVPVAAPSVGEAEKAGSLPQNISGPPLLGPEPNTAYEQVRPSSPTSVPQAAPADLPFPVTSFHTGGLPTPLDLANERPIAGYPGLSKFLSLDPDALIFRRFSQLSARNILYIQDRLAVLEEKLAERDALDVPVFDDCRNDIDEERWGIMREVRQLLVEYEQAVKAHKTLLELPSPSGRQLRHVRKWFNHEQPVLEEQMEYIYKDDLFALQKASNDTALTFVEKSDFLVKLLQKKTPEDSEKNANDQQRNREPCVLEAVTSYKQTPIRRFIRACILIFGWIFLVAPIIPLYLLDYSKALRLVIVAVFQLAFSGIMAVYTDVKNWEMLAAMAAYSAVLVVFLQLEESQPGKGMTNTT